MADNMVKVVVDMVVNGRDQVRGAADDIDKLGPAGSGATRGIGALAGSLAAAGGVMVAAGFAAKKLWDVMGEGAQLQTTALRFDKLTASIGSTSDAMLGNLREATKGMISDAELMASASQLISLKLADNADQVVRLATVAGVLNWDMQQVILTFANLSTMRLDALGLSVDEVTGKQKELEAQGWSTAAAFKEAVIQAGEARLEVGGVGEAEESMMRAAAAVDNFKNSLLSSITATLEQAGAFDALSNAAAELSGFSSFATELERLYKAGEITRPQFNELNATIRRGGEEMARASLSAMQLADALSTEGMSLDDSKAEHVAWAQQVAMSTQLSATEYQEWLDLVGIGSDATRAALQQQASDFATWSDAVAWAVGRAEAAQWGRQAASGAKGSLSDMYARRGSGNTWDRNAPMPTERATVSMSTYGGAVGYAISQEDALAASHARLSDAFTAEATARPEDGLINAEGLVNVEAMNEALYQQAQSAGASAVELAMLGVATGKFSKEQAAAALKAAVLQETIRKVAEGVASGNVKYDDAVGYLEEFRQKLDASGGGAEDATANVEDLVGMAKELTEGPYQADINANTTQARAELQATLDLIHGISGVHQATIVVSTEDDGGGGGVTPQLAGGTSWPTYEGPELTAPSYGSYNRPANGLLDWQGGGINIAITNIVDGQVAGRSELDDITTDKMLRALQSVGLA